MEKEFLHIVEEHQAIIYKVCKMYRDTREDQEDLFQEIVLQLWKAFPAFRGEAKVSTWMYRIALNTGIAMYRKQKVSFSDSEGLTKHPEPMSDEGTSENEERMFEAIRQLTRAERAIIALYLEGYPHKEIADITGITENYVGVKMSRIKEKLKNILNER